MTPLDTYGPVVDEPDEPEPGLPPPVLLGCECCGWVNPRAEARPLDDGGCCCQRCGHVLHPVKPMSLQRTWALLAAATVLYVPANLLPIMTTTNAFRSSPHTLIGGIADLWAAQAWTLAVLVFIASIVVPLLKIVALGLLAWSVPQRPGWRRLERARLYRMVEAVGHWSMLDVYVVLLLVGMVRFGGLASASPGPGLLAFAAVVILTMLATHSFDPRLIWQSVEEADADASAAPAPPAAPAISPSSSAMPPSSPVPNP